MVYVNWIKAYGDIVMLTQLRLREGFTQLNTRLPHRGGKKGRFAAGRRRPPSGQADDTSCA